MIYVVFDNAGHGKVDAAAAFILDRDRAAHVHAEQSGQLLRHEDGALRKLDAFAGFAVAQVDVGSEILRVLRNQDIA